MNKEVLIQTIKRLTAPSKGILAIDESIPTCNKRFETLGIPTTEEKRREYRELLVTAPKIENYLSGFILFDETIRQAVKSGKTFISILKEKGIEIGIKVDTGTKDFLNTPEKITEGLDGLEVRLKEYKAMGATFTKWRQVITIGANMPTEANLSANAEALAKYAALCQAQDLVPIVEPEVLMDGNHTIAKCYEVTARNLDILFSKLKEVNVSIQGIILKTSMVIPGKDSGEKITDEDIAILTIKCLEDHVPKDIGGIVFLSGGMADEEATLRLNAMKKIKNLPWPLTFSYGRAIQNDTLIHWAKNPSDVSSAQKKLLEKSRANSLASMGKYK